MLPIEDFVHELVTNLYIYRPNGRLCSGFSVNRRVAPVQDGVKVKANGDEEPNWVLAADWIARVSAVEQMSWVPGQDEFIEDKLINNGGWFAHEGSRIYNLYKGPVRVPRVGTIEPWVNHIKALWGEEAAEHILNWFAFKVQFPGIKINHALVLGGGAGIGKDTVLAPLREAVGPWNMAEISPADLLERFNPWVESVVLRVSEGKDLGEIDRFKFYEHTKKLIAAPPEVLTVNPKHIKPYIIPNLTGVIITTNYLKHGIYLPTDDRRHYVAWSDKERGFFDANYWDTMWRWYDNGGYEAILYCLVKRDLKAFNPKAPPRQTDAFFKIVEGHKGPEAKMVEEALDQLDWPEVTTWQIICSEMRPADGEHCNNIKLRDRVNDWLKASGDETERNPGDKERGRWQINKAKVTIYVNVNKVAPQDRLLAAQRLTDSPPSPPKAADLRKALNCLG